ncbi:MAG: quinone-dependent dihydroorotate dehydrogenase [Parvularculales bacterium]
MSLYNIVAPLLAHLDPERAHRLALFGLKVGLAPNGNPAHDVSALRTSVLGRTFPNPLGLAAGFDKNAEAPVALLRLGFGFVEVGTVTPYPQDGNRRPRIFRLPHDRAIINRLGFNNDGHDKVKTRLEALRAQNKPSESNIGRSSIVGVNLGAGRNSSDRIADYTRGFKVFGSLADYITINISSPNTPGLRTLQKPQELQTLIARLNEARHDKAEHDAPDTPLLVKIAPDLDEAALTTIAETALEGGIDGFIISNTTTAREGLHHPQSTQTAQEEGGLSGAPLMAPSTRMLAHLYRLTHGRLPLIGVGGIFSGADAYTKIRAGASLVQLYTGFAFEGPLLIERIKQEITACLARDGYTTIKDAIGSHAEQYALNKGHTWPPDNNSK